MSTFKVFKETSLPASLQPNSLYFIAASADATLAEIYITNQAGTATRHVINKSEIQTMIDNSIAAHNELRVVADISARNALNPSRSMYVFVTDATGDSTVSSGGATYLYNLAATTWIKTSEAESLDVVLTWSAIQNKPTSSVADIDDAVTRKHSHANITQLDKLGVANGELTYDGTQVKTEWGTTGW